MDVEKDKRKRLTLTHTEVIKMGEGGNCDGLGCMCGCHVIEDPVNMGQRCDICGCISGLHKLMRESGQR